MSIMERLTDPNFLVAMATAIATMAVVFSLGSRLFSKNQMKAKMKKVALEREKLRAAEIARLGAKNKDGDLNMRGQAAKSFITDIVDRFSLKNAFMDEKAKNMLKNAGLRSEFHQQTYVFSRFVVPIVLLVLAFVYLSTTLLTDKSTLEVGLYSLAVGLVGSYLPVMYMKKRVTKRQQSIRRSWPDSLDLLLLCVDSGMSIEHAVQRVAREIGLQSLELSEELALTSAELNFLEERTRAFQNLGDRVGLDAVKSVMTAFIQSEKYGTPIGQALRVMAEEGRVQRMTLAEKKAASLPPKLTVPLIVFFLPVLFIVIIAPAAISLTQGPSAPF